MNLNIRKVRGIPRNFGVNPVIITHCMTLTLHRVISYHTVRVGVAFSHYVTRRDVTQWLRLQGYLVLVVA